MISLIWKIPLFLFLSFIIMGIPLGNNNTLFDVLSEASGARVQNIYSAVKNKIKSGATLVKDTLTPIFVVPPAPEELKREPAQVNHEQEKELLPKDQYTPEERQLLKRILARQ